VHDQHENQQDWDNPTRQASHSITTRMMDACNANKNERVMEGEGVSKVVLLAAAMMRRLAVTRAVHVYR